MIMEESIDKILENVKTATNYLTEDNVNEFTDAILKSNAVFVIGVGRSGLVAKAFAMRLMHLDITTYVVGETITPSINEGDSLIAISGSGETHMILSAAKTSKERKAKILSLTSYKESSLGQLSDIILPVKGRTKDDIDKDYLKRQFEGKHASLTPLGTLFEITSLIFLDGLIAELMIRLEKTEEDLKKKHTVLE